jgi:hypothetical protein
MMPVKREGDIENGTPAGFVGLLGVGAVRRAGIEPVTLGLNALVSLCTS